jgi:hypothetical protein
MESLNMESLNLSIYPSPPIPRRRTGVELHLLLQQYLVELLCLRRHHIGLQQRPDRLRGQGHAAGQIRYSLRAVGGGERHRALHRRLPDWPELRLWAVGLAGRNGAGQRHCAQQRGAVRALGAGRQQKLQRFPQLHSGQGVALRRIWPLHGGRQHRAASGQLLHHHRRQRDKRLVANDDFHHQSLRVRWPGKHTLLLPPACAAPCATASAAPLPTASRPWKLSPASRHRKRL